MDNSLFDMEKRVFQRVPVRIEFNCCDIDCYGFITNLSASGIFMESKNINFPLESQFEICIPRKKYPLNIRVRIKRITKSNEYYDGLGVEVLEPSHKYLELVYSLKGTLHQKNKDVCIGSDNRDFFDWCLSNRKRRRMSL